MNLYSQRMQVSEGHDDGDHNGENRNVPSSVWAEHISRLVAHHLLYHILYTFKKLHLYGLWQR